MKEKVDQEELLRIFPGKLRKRIEEKVSFEEDVEKEKKKKNKKNTGFCHQKN